MQGAATLISLAGCTDKPLPSGGGARTVVPSAQGPKVALVSACRSCAAQRGQSAPQCATFSPTDLGSPCHPRLKRREERPAGCSSAAAHGLLPPSVSAWRTLRR